jgi:putative membrane protein insertion efficiency factor
MKRAVQFALRSYKRWISPMLPHACRFVPTCSEFAHEAVERYGVLRGGALAFARLLRCHPFARAGYDPVPLEERWFAHPHQIIGSSLPKPVTRRY